MILGQRKTSNAPSLCPVRIADERNPSQDHAVRSKHLCRHSDLRNRCCHLLSPRPCFALASMDVRSLKPIRSQLADL